MRSLQQCLFILALVLFGCSKPMKLEPYGELGSFSLKNQHNQAFTQAQLQDKIWIADFIFTSCTTVCPRLTEQLRWVQAQLKDDVTPPMLLSFSVDPINDTPQKLTQYIQSHTIDDQGWYFLTGELGAMKDLVVKGFKQAMGKDPAVPQEIFHGSHFILGRGKTMYGYFSSNKEGLSELVQATRALRKRPRSL